MYRLVSQEYIDMINSNIGVLAAKLEIGDITVDSDSIYGVTCESVACPEKLSVGNFVMPKLTFSVSKEVELPLVTSGLKVAFYVGMSADGTDFEYALVCSAEIVSVTQKGQLFEIETQSKISSKLDRVYNSELIFPASSYEVLSELGELIDAELSYEGIVTDFTIESEPAGYSCREVIASIAEKSGVNAFVSRDDTTIVFKWFEYAETEINSDCLSEPALSVETVCYKGVTCTNGSELLVLGEEPFLTLNNINRFIKTQEDLVAILDAVSNLSYRPGTISLVLGNILFDPWDIVSVSVDDTVVKLPLCSLAHKYDGGLTTEIRLPDREKTASDGTSASKTTAERAVDRLTADLINTKLFMADKASVNILEADVANISSILAGNVGAGSLQTISLTASNAMASDLFVKNTIAQHLAVADLQAGDINTSKFRVVSESGNFLISDNTLRIADEISTTRVQLGKDALGDYSLYVWDAQGNLMFDALGVHEAGIKEGIIRDDMVSDTANISAGKLNIDSLFTAINSDGSHTLNASKVLLDADAQTLDVAFGALNTKVTDVDSRVSTMGTELSVVQGQITSKIWEQDITTAINEVEGDITALSTSYSTLSQDVSSFRTEVAETYTTNAEFDDAFDVHGTANGSPITISDSADAQFEGLKVYGNSIQDGTPTPDAPVEIVSVGDKRDTLVSIFKENMFATNIATQTKNGIAFTVNGDGTFTAKGTRTSTSNVEFQFRSGGPIIYVTKGKYYTLKTDIIEGDFTSCGIYGHFIDMAGKVTYNVFTINKKTYKPTKNGRIGGVAFVVSGNNEVNITFRIQLVASNTAPEWTPPAEPQLLPLATSGNGLRGIPVESDGNYTDESGQMWIADELDFARGVLVRRTALIESYNGEEIITPYISSTGELTTGATVIYAVDAVETPLTDEEMTAYKSLKTNYPFTTVLVNDGAGIELDYRRHTKAIDFATTSYTNAAIEQSADEIKQSVSASVEALDGRLTTAEAGITVNAGNIAQKVSSSDYNGEKIASLINQSASTVTINASHIKLEGVVTANEGFKIDTDGSMEATSGKIGSFIITDLGIRNSDNTFAIVPTTEDSETDGNRVIGLGGTPTARNLGIFSNGSIRVGPNNSNRLILNAGNIDFLYGNTLNGRLGQPFGDAPGFEGCDLYLSTNNKYLYGMTADGYAQRMLGITAAGNMVLSAPTNSAKLYLYSSEEMYFYLGSTRVLAMEQNGLRFANDKGILLNEKIAMRYYDSAVYCGAQSEPLKLVGSSVTSNGASVTSDARMKNHIAPLDEKYTALLGVLEPKQYMYNDHNTGTTNVGFVAQEVLEALSRVGLTTQDFGGFVDVYGDGREYALDYTQFIPILWATVQKLIERT